MSSSSDDEDTNLLKEAVDNDFLPDSLFKVDKNNCDDIKHEKLPSLRPKHEESMSVFNVTPQFQTHIAKRLTALLDKQVEYKDVSSTMKRKKIKSKVKLLRESQEYLKVTPYNSSDDVNTSTTKDTLEYEKNRLRYTHSIIKRYKIDPEIDCETDEVKVKSVAVDLDYIKTEVKSWSNRSKAPVFEYKKAKNGTYELHS